MIFVYTKGKYRHCFADLFIISQLVSNVRFKTGPWGIKGDENFSFLPASISPAVKSVTAFTCLYMARLLMNQRSPRTSTYTKHLYFDVGLTRHWSWKCSHINTPPPSPIKRIPQSQDFAFSVEPALLANIIINYYSIFQNSINFPTSQKKGRIP